MRHILAGLSGVLISLAIYIATGEAGWRMLLSGLILILGIRVIIELSDLEKLRDRNMEEVSSGEAYSFEQARELLLAMLESTKREGNDRGRVIADIVLNHDSGMYTWSLQREKVKKS